MHIIQLEALEEGVYNDHKADYISEPPEGWAMIPDGFEKPSTFPRLGSIEAKELPYTFEVEVQKVNEETGEMEIVKELREKVVMTVTKMTEGILPEIIDVEPEPTAEELLNAMLGVTSYE